MKIKKLGNYDFCANYIYDAHTHAEFEINYVNTGGCMMVIEHENVVLHKGDCVLILPQVRHNFMVSGAQKCQITQFEFLSNDSHDPIGTSLSKQTHYCKISNCSDVLESISNLYGYRNKVKDSEYHKKLFDLEFQKLSVLLEFHIHTADAEARRYESEPLRDMLHYINIHYEQTINLAVLAKQNGISPRYLRKIFVGHTGLSAIDYITMLRMEKAKDLLKNSKRTISDIAIEVGYNSFQYFSMMFKKKIGMTPSAFRQQYQL